MERAIHLLPPELIHRIAAGEIVDRPASVLKELLENSSDAGATEIQVDLRDGGLSLIKVRDNGWGFSESDLHTALQRHATSKISTLSDLDAICSLGFRGEALAATASVSRLTIRTRRALDPQGWELESLGGQKLPLKPTTCPLGTSVEVQELFFNVPARRQFLKSAASELSESWFVVQNFALAHPEISIRAFAIDSKGELKREAEWKASDSETRFVQVKNLVEEPIHSRRLDSALGLKRIEVWLARPPQSSNHSRDIHFVVNGRPIVDKRLPYSLRDSLAGLIEPSRFPVALFVMDVDPHLIDVNIHPQKREVRWPDSVSAPGLAYRLVRDALATLPGSLPSVKENQAAPELSASPLFAVTELQEQTAVPVIGVVPSAPARVDSLGSSGFRTATREGAALRFSNLRVVGEVGASWIVAESELGLVLVDQHAAHERVEYDRWFRSDKLFRSRPVLLPQRIKVPEELLKSVPQVQSLLENLGFEMETHSSELELLAVPEADRRIDWKSFFEQLWERVREGMDPDALALKLRSDLAASLACHGSVRRGRRLKVEEIQELFQQLDQVDWGGLCPHGRPVYRVLTHESIADSFHR
jgi:DNA mismatch repair protein MutL